MRSARLALLVMLLGACSSTRDMPHRAPLDDEAPARPAGSSGAPAEADACVGEGTETPSLDAEGRPRGAPSPCCSGLAPAPIYKGSIVRLDECELASPARFFCVRCGDGRCGRGETACNCPADCHL